MAEKVLAFIREAECIGCTKCIDVCPVDAILGSNKHMHTVISQECIGCKLCIPACPVDCIDLRRPQNPARLPSDYVKKRYQARKKRLEQKDSSIKLNLIQTPILQKKKYIQAAVARAKLKCQIKS